MASHKNLSVWQKSMTLVEEIYRITKRFPKEEIYSLTSQIRRSAISIPSNIAEGRGRNHKLEYVQFLMIARGSLNELETQLEIAKRLIYISEEDFNHIDVYIIEVEKMLNALATSIENKK